MEHGDLLGDMFDQCGLSDGVGRKNDGEMRGYDAEEKMVVLPADGLDPVKVILSDRGIANCGKDHCITFRELRTTLRHYPPTRLPSTLG
jgi:hypothetical protein